MLDRVRGELFVGDDVFALDADLDIELDFILPDDEPLEELLFEAELLALVIFPRVVLVLGIFLASVFFLISGLVILTLLAFPESVILVDLS